MSVKEGVLRAANNGVFGAGRGSRDGLRTVLLGWLVP